ncbi:hypothetical protein M407DRAFT_30762 [Tulasnella calospora MUT 4182]|uniref:Uncharacterized protein n=1 Tax=Tulasnella calospora MUT 4182 TaxID=1051891 RepID=A0A0C3PX17_9AGAM|nr:hypothetical protein M407DRAFT_30762 [Tulasnella calospora MUT 4182]
MSHVHGLSLKHLENSTSDQNPYHHFFQIIAPTLARPCGTLALCNEIYSKAVCLRPEEIHAPWPDAAAAVSTASFGVVAEDPHRAVRMMVTFLTSHRIDTRLTVIANGNRPTTFVAPHTTFVPSQTTSYFPEDVLGELPGTVTKISASVLADAAKILTFLRSIRRDKNTGRLGWAYPRLEVLDFGAVQGLTVGQVQSFLAGRYSDGNPLLIDGEVVQRPRLVTIKHRFLVDD